MFKVITPTRPGARDIDGSSPADEDVWTVVVRSAASINASAVDFQDCIASSVIRWNLRIRRVAERVESANLSPTRCEVPLPRAHDVGASRAAEANSSCEDPSARHRPWTESSQTSGGLS